MRTNLLRRQHDAAVVLVEEIGQLSGEGSIDDVKAFRLGLLLAKLTGLLRIHFAAEDRSLYPLLAASKHRETAEMARRFQQEMGGLAPAYEAFAGRWATSSAISTDPSGFVRESREIFRALGERIQRENGELYRMADALPPELAA